MMPKDKFMRAANFHRNAKKDYEKNPKRLACCINIALVTHVVLGDEVAGKKLYVEALELSEANPLITRAFALFLISTCEAPILRVREKAEKWIVEAKRRDESNSKFDSALSIYQYALLRKPKDVRALTNLALAYILIYDENVKGEKLLRRALSISPFDERVVEIWKYVKDRFEERQLVYNPQARIDKVNTNKGGKKRTIHGRVATEDPAWAGWVYIEEDVHKVSKIIGSYWYNPVDGEERVHQPEFKVEWGRRQRT
jgi:tetratricopeptide (TPR) repeat protein